MPSKKKKYNARFPAGRIKKIMQTDEEVGKVALAVPIIISRTLELFVESLLKKAMQVTNAKNAKTLSPSHMKQCILSESRFDFLKELVEKIPDVCVTEEVYEPSVAKSEKQDPIASSDINKIPKIPNAHSEGSSSKRRLSERQSFENNGSQNLNAVVDLSVGNKSMSEPPQSSSGPNFYKELSCPSTIVTGSVIQFSPKIQTTKKLSHSVHSIMNHTPTKVPKLSTNIGNIVNTFSEPTDTKPIFHLDLSQTGCKSDGAPSTLTETNVDVKDINQAAPVFHLDLTKYDSQTPPPLVPIADGHLVHPSHKLSFGNDTNDDLDEDYDN